MAVQPKRVGQAGMGVDAHGGAVIDPTANVIALVRAEKTRSDDLRKAERRYFMAQLRHVEKTSKLRSEHQAKMDAAESARIDSIRQIDIQGTATAAAQALTAIQTLSAANATREEQVRTLVSSTAAGLATTNAAASAEFNKRLATLEQSSFLEMGKQKVADPQLERLSSLVEQLARSRAGDTGKTQGLSDAWKIIITLVGLFFGYAAYQGRPAPVLSPPPYIYSPAPQGTQLPTIPPATVPR
jgi:ribosome assembly protein YihI (activator of Der GTPase)